MQGERGDEDAPRITPCASYASCASFLTTLRPFAPLLAAPLGLFTLLRGDPRSVWEDWWWRTRSCLRLNERSHPGSLHPKLRMPRWTLLMWTWRLFVREKAEGEDGHHQQSARLR